jgi:hypothetical protein
MYIILQVGRDSTPHHLAIEESRAWSITQRLVPCILIPMLSIALRYPEVLTTPLFTHSVISSGGLPVIDLMAARCLGP